MIYASYGHLFLLTVRKTRVMLFTMKMIHKKLTAFLLCIALIMLQTLTVSAEAERKKIFKIPQYNGFKSYERGILEDGKTIFHEGTRQFELQKRAKTRKGFRTVRGRYLVALGSRFTKNIGQYVTLILENGYKIPCIVGDQKADRDTDDSHTFTENECCSEFIVDMRTLNQDIKEKGDVSGFRKAWDSPVSAIIVYEKNVFD